MNDVCESIEPHILPEYRQTFREMTEKYASGEVTLRFRGVRDPFRELRRLFKQGGQEK